MRFSSAWCRSMVGMTALLAACAGSTGSGDVPVTDTTQARCVAVEDCDDGDGCTIDQCVAGRCVNTPRDCNDNNPCTTDQCIAGTCAHQAQDGCCADDSACDDGDFCTPDHCVQQVCQFGAPVEGCCNTADQCDDGNDCTFDDCALHKCTHVPDKNAGCCEKDQDCLDQNACTTDTCVAGKCKHTNNGCCEVDKDCVSDDPCQTGTCEAGQTCKYTRTPDCCSKDADCAAIACTTVLCKDLACQRTTIPACCAKDADCGDACKTCSIPADTTDGTCTVKTTGACCIATLLTTTFDDLAGFTVEGLGKAGYDATPTWVVDTKRSVSPPSSLYFGDPATHTYEQNSIGKVGGRAVTGTLDLGRTLSPVLAFQLFKATDMTYATDVLSVVIVASGRADRVAWSTSGQSIGTTNGAWLPYTVSLAAYQGEQVQVAFEFDSVDHYPTPHEGVYIDDVTISGICPP